MKFLGQHSLTKSKATTMTLQFVSEELVYVTNFASARHCNPIIPRVYMGNTSVLLPMLC